MQPWEHTMIICFKEKPAINVQLQNKLIAEIIAGNLKPDQKLPSARDLAAFYQLDKKTIERAYRQLQADKWIYSKKRIGHFVCSQLPVLQNFSISKLLIELSQLGYSNELELYQERTSKNSHPNAKKHTNPTGIIYSETLNKYKLAGFRKYNSAQFNRNIDSAELLGEAISQLLWERGIAHKENEYCYMRGGNNIYHLLFSTFLQAGDLVLMSAPCNMRVYHLLTHCKMQVILIDGDQETFVNSITQYSKSRKVRMVIAETDCHFPSTSTFNYTQKLKLHALSTTHNFLILEINSGQGLWYPPAPFEPLININRSHVIHIGSVASFLDPVHTLKYLVSSADMIRRMLSCWSYAGFYEPVYNLVMHELISKNILNEVIRKTRKECKTKMEHFEELFQASLQEHFNFQMPLAGSDVWLSLKGSNDYTNIFANSKSRLSMYAPESYTPQESKITGIRLALGNLKARQIEETVSQILKQLSPL